MAETLWRGRCGISYAFLRKPYGLLESSRWGLSQHDAVPPGGELPLDELGDEPDELDVDLLTDEELELGRSCPNGGGNDLGELHGSSLRLAARMAATFTDD